MDQSGMSKWDVEFTAWTWRYTITVKASNEHDASTVFWKDNPEATRIVSIMPHGQAPPGTFEERLEIARQDALDSPPRPKPKR